ncbi:hypothetical protein GCM10010306_021700 [Streptomyces umbrinus]|uniref:hypothetical protein n=1 Tax=Streptomyces umbrinus TaxID=67370 RepID=UPI00167ADE18|nr:hypothetical protein [Streptomyces umbrinus]GHB28934.1 hypothetical protein GCM10010306_021700 [Streptomyces umbrinus]
MFHLFDLALFAALIAIAAIAVAFLAIEAGGELTEPQARVLCAVMTTLGHVATGVGAALLGQDTPLTLVVKAVIPLLW